MTQLAVSHAVSALEKELQVSLFERDRNGIFLIKIGKRVLIQAQKMLVCAEHIRQHTSAAVRLETVPPAGESVVLMANEQGQVQVIGRLIAL